MEHFVTIFDSLFVPQGLALHMSMERHIQNYSLWIVCVDDDAFLILKKLSLPNVKLLRLSDLETEELLAAKKNRSAREYCWTLTPFAPKFVFESDSRIKRVTYIDADIWFRKNPSPIFEEFNNSGKSVLITDHGYSPLYDQSATVGQFCVQFMTFERTKGEQVRDWWEKKCLEWCYDRVEAGKLGDQKYLDQWPIIFPLIVHTLVDREMTLAPWNIDRFPYGNSIIFHFQGLRILDAKHVKPADLPINRLVVDNVYRPYLNDLSKVISLLISHGVNVKSQSSRITFYGYVVRALSIIKRRFMALMPVATLKIY